MTMKSVESGVASECSPKVTGVVAVWLLVLADAMQQDTPLPGCVWCAHQVVWCWGQGTLNPSPLGPCSISVW